MSTSRREKNKQLVAERAERLMTDTRFQALRTHRARIALAVAMIALFVVIPAAWILLGSIAGVISVLVGIVVWRMLRMSVRLVAELPEEYLDERQRTVRNRSYVDAHRWFAGLIILVASSGIDAFIMLGEDSDS